MNAGEIVTICLMGCGVVALIFFGDFIRRDIPEALRGFGSRAKGPGGGGNISPTTEDAGKQQFSSGSDFGTVA